MVPSPSTTKIGAFGSASRAALANESEPPIEPRDAVDHAAAHREHALAPLGELAAVADQHRVGIALHIGAQRAEHLRGMQAARRLRRDRSPRRPGDCRARRALPSASRRRAASSRRRARSASRPRRATSAMLPSTSRPSISFAARSTSAASGSIEISRTAGSNDEPLAQRVVKSSALPSSTIRSARAHRDRRMRRASHPRCRAGFPGSRRAPASRLRAAPSSARPLTLESCGGAKMIGRAADAIASSIASATGIAAARARPTARASGHTIALLSTRSSSRSDGRLRCTGPGRPDVAMRIASPTSRPSVAADVAVNEALAHRRRHVGLADFLKAAAAKLPRGGVARRAAPSGIPRRAPCRARRPRWRGPARRSPSRCRARR